MQNVGSHQGLCSIRSARELTNNSRFFIDHRSRLFIKTPAIKFLTSIEDMHGRGEGGGVLVLIMGAIVRGGSGRGRGHG